MALKISYQWLKEILAIEQSEEKLGHHLSQTGFETEIVKDALHIDPSVVIGEVMSVQPHPNADRLNICQVSTGRETLQIVCGCPSVRHAKKVIVAPWVQCCQIWF